MSASNFADKDLATIAGRVLDDSIPRSVHGFLVTQPAEHQSLPPRLGVLHIGKPMLSSPFIYQELSIMNPYYSRTFKSMVSAKNSSSAHICIAIT